MVSFYNHPFAMYQKNQSGANLSSPYSASPSAAWYSSNYHQPPTGQFLGDSDAPPQYYPHHMFHQSSPDWAGHENYAAPPQNSTLLHGSNGHSGGPGSGFLQINQSNQNHHPNGNNNEHINDGLHSLPSPPITVSGSDMSSPSALNGASSPQINSNRPTPVKSPYEWMKKPSYQNQPNPGKTRTKDKYRVVYTDHQRLELEKDFHYTRYITIRRKTELAQTLALSERQVKIWFQNRRAKDRKVKKKGDMGLYPHHLPPPPMPPSSMNQSPNAQHQLYSIKYLPSPPITVSGSDMSSPGAPNGPLSPHNNTNRPTPVKSPYEWMKKTSYQNQPNPGKTRTKDKYRVVYTDHQRLELEKEFHYTRYITIRRKSELAQSLTLSERQVKIWFQNRRAKDRKQKKKMDAGGNVVPANGQTILSQSHNNNHNSALANLSNMLDVKPKIEPSLQHLQHLHQMSAMGMGMGQMGLHAHHALHSHHLPPSMTPTPMHQSSNSQQQSTTASSEVMLG
ncbi:unnamed protein product [Diamesa serratosioi]